MMQERCLKENLTKTISLQAGALHQRAGFVLLFKSAVDHWEAQQVTGNTVELAYVDQGYTGTNAAEAPRQHGIRLEVVKHPMGKRGFVLLPKRWVVERSFAGAARFRRLARDYERLDTTLKGLCQGIERLKTAVSQ